MLEIKNRRKKKITGLLAAGNSPNYDMLKVLPLGYAKSTIYCELKGVNTRFSFITLQLYQFFKKLLMQKFFFIKFAIIIFIKHFFFDLLSYILLSKLLKRVIYNRNTAFAFSLNLNK